MSIEGQGHFFTIYFQVLYVLCFTNVKISGERLQDQWSSGNEPCYKEVEVYHERQPNIIKEKKLFVCFFVIFKCLLFVSMICMDFSMCI